MQITITVGADGNATLAASEDRPWLAVKLLRQMADAIAEQQAQNEARPKVEVATLRGPLPFARNGGR